MSGAALRNRLALRLVDWSLLIRSVLTVFSTGLQLVPGCARQKNQVSADLDRFDQALKRSLECALWRLDFNQLDVILDVDGALDAAHDPDGARLTQGVTNLTDKATKYTRSGEVRITVRTDPGVDPGQDMHRLEISVSDTGDGIDERQRQSVFDRFTQNDTGLSRAQGGSGPGLSIRREICALMGAKLDLEPPEGDGFSTRLLITLGCIVRVGADDSCAQKSIVG